MKKEIKVVIIDGKQVIQVEGVPDFPADDDELDEFINEAMKNIDEGMMIEKMIEEEKA